jgi:hypothetical protein
METKNNKVCYKSKLSKIKNTIIIEKEPKYLIFIYDSLTCQKNLLQTLNKKKLKNPHNTK